MKLFEQIEVCSDFTPHSAAMNMAIDEALLESVAAPSIRFYRWYSPALSFGYFGKFSDVEIYKTKRDVVRRWTGGGIVFHGEDLTYSLVIPASDPTFAKSSMAIYDAVHRALADALSGIGEHAIVAGSGPSFRSSHVRADDPDPGDAAMGIRRAGIIDAGYSCFATPVRADVMIDGRKVAGAAQRRTHRGLLQQGSIQNISLHNALADRFAHALSANCSEREINEKILWRAGELTELKYGTSAWLRKR
jgi:lipoate-protein ligase A